MASGRRTELIKELYQLTGKLSSLVDEMLNVELREHWMAKTRRAKLSRAAVELRALADRLEAAGNDDEDGEENSGE